MSSAKARCLVARFESHRYGEYGLERSHHSFDGVVRDHRSHLCILKLFGVDPAKRKTRDLLQGFNGCAKPGEMVLVIGRPGAGCSTFLKTIANKRTGFIDTQGETHYGGIDAKEMAKRYMGEVVYSEEDDQHHATLTVARTIDFALRLKATSKMLPEHTKKEYRKLIRDTFLKMVNIEHTKHTLVGSATVRGVSGGERKRVSILEGLASGASVFSWDNSTRGLDASTALDYVKSMRVLTDLLEATMFVSLYQASEGIWEQFDKVLVIDEGRCVYFGPRTEARQYFIDLGFADRPRQTSADYITGCTDQYERIFQEGRDASNVPSDAEALEAAYRKSRFFTEAIEERKAFDAVATADAKATQEFRQAVVEAKHRGVRQKSQYTVSYAAQVQALFLRQCRCFSETSSISSCPTLLPSSSPCLPVVSSSTCLPLRRVFSLVVDVSSSCSSSVRSLLSPNCQPNDGSTHLGSSDQFCVLPSFGSRRRCTLG